MSLRKKFFSIAIFLLSIIHCLLYGQNIVIKYVGNSNTSINLTYLYRELGNSTATLNRSNRMLTIKSNKPEFINCNDIMRSTIIYAEPNEIIDIDINDKGLLIYKCNKSPIRKFESEFINDCYEKYGPIDEVFVKKILLMSKNKNKQVNIDENYENENTLLDKYFEEKKTSIQFHDYFKSVFWSLSLINKMNNPKEQNTAFNDLKTSFPKANRLINVTEYRRALICYTLLSMKNLKTKPTVNNFLQFTSTHFPNQIIIDYLSYYKIKFSLLQSKPRIDNISLNMFYNICKNKQFTSEIKTDFNKKTSSVFLKKLIEKSGCKLAVIDFWASWCKPCLEEIPYSLSRIKEYPQIKYIFISIDKSKSDWINETKKRTDVFNSSNSFMISEIKDENLLKSWNVTIIPRFILLNKKGEIINLNFPRPSDPNFKTIIDEILSKQ